MSNKIDLSLPDLSVNSLKMVKLTHLGLIYINKCVESQTCVSTTCADIQIVKRYSYAYLRVPNTTELGQSMGNEEAWAQGAKLLAFRLSGTPKISVGKPITHPSLDCMQRVLKIVIDICYSHCPTKSYLLTKLSLKRSYRYSNGTHLYYYVIMQLLKGVNTNLTTYISFKRFKWPYQMKALGICKGSNHYPCYQVMNISDKVNLTKVFRGLFRHCRSNIPTISVGYHLDGC